jgi:hypothetical protein
MSDFYNSNGSVKTTTVSYKAKGTNSCSANTDTCNLNTITTSLTKALYENINVTVTATWTDGLPITNKNGKSVTITMVKDTSKSTATKWYYKLPVNSGSNLNLAKAYIPINWKDNTTWKISYTATITYDQLNLSVTKDGADKGHSHTLWDYYYTYKYNSKTKRYEAQKDANGNYIVNWYSYKKDFSLLVDVVNWSYTSQRKIVTATAGVTVKGSMYEDDFTGSKK